MKPIFPRWIALGSFAALFAIAPHAAFAATGQPQMNPGPSQASSQGTGEAVLRVCADPDYLPFSNRAGQGFENKVAEIVAKAMGRKLDYVWASTRGQGGYSNFLAENLDAAKCDVVMDLPTGDVIEQSTKPYYKSAYVFISRKDKTYNISSMGSPALRQVKIGFESDTTPETAIKLLGLLNNAVPFNIASDPHASPKSLLTAVQDGKVGVMITWEPAIGMFMKDYPGLIMTRVPAEEYGPGLPQVHYSYDMSMGVRKGDTALKDALDKVIASHQGEITATLAKYNVILPPKQKHVNFSNQ